MCIEPVSAAAMALSAGAKLAQGVSDFQAGNANARMAQMEGRSAMQAANAQASQINAAGDRAISQIQSQQAANGVDLSSGSAADVAAESRRNIELDRLTALYEGRMRMWSKSAEAAQHKAQAKAGLVTGILSASGSLLGDAAQAGMFADKPQTPDFSRIY